MTALTLSRTQLRVSVAAALLATICVTWLVLSAVVNTSGTQGDVSFHAVEGSTSVDEPTALESPANNDLRVVVETTVPENTNNLGEEAFSSEVGSGQYGTVVGEVYDANLGELLPNRRLVFSDSPSLEGATIVRAKSDDLGFFERRLPVGLWYVSVLHTDPRVPSNELVMREVGTVEIMPGMQSSFTAILWGEREVTGEITIRPKDLRTLGYDDESGFPLHLELYHADRPGEILAHASVTSYLTEPWAGRGKREDAPEGEKNETESPFTMGAFSFTHLEPGRYYIRIWDRGNNVFLKEHVDLTNADARVVREIAFGEFLNAMRKQRD